MATSLIEGEACKKHCGVLDIRGNEFRLEPLPMKKVRPFKMNEIYLNELPELDTIDPNDPEIALHSSNVSIKAKERASRMEHCSYSQSDFY